MTTDDPTYGDDKKKRVIKPPSDFEDEAAFLKHIRTEIDLDMTADQDNQKAALEDAKFLVGNQWPDDIKARREGAQKPTLTINRLPAFVAQIIGNRRLNETVIKIVPDNGGTKAVAHVREGLIRSIQKSSRAKIAYDKANEGQVIGGLGNFQVVLEYAADDVFDQDIRIAAILNPHAVVWDRMLADPTGSDAGHVTVMDDIPVAVFRKAYPGAVTADAIGDATLLTELRLGNWINDNLIRVASYWRMRSRVRTLALFTDGSVQDVTDKDPAVYAEQVMKRKDGTPIMREAERRYAELYVVSGMELLDGPYELPIPRVPVLRVPGWEANVGEVRHRWGLVRFLKDPQRLHNYWRSVVAEKLMLTPKAPWVARAGAVAGREDAWRKAHLSDDPLLIFNDDAAEAPVRTPPAQMEQALILEAGTSTQDIKDISNLHEASLGQQSNEVSGKAIMARQRVGELGSVIYNDNLNLAIEQAGVIINELIPIAYTGPRTIKIVGPDDKEALQVINNSDDPESIDISIGKYAVSVTTGPSYVTKRIEAAESMLNMVNAIPNTMALAADKIVEAQDWPGADEIARRLRSALPPGTVDQQDMTPQQQQDQQQAAQVQVQQAELAKRMAEAELAEQLAKVEEIKAKTALLNAQAQRATIEPRIKAAQADTDARSTQLNDALRAIEVAEQKDEPPKGAKNE
jgi:hypothetical protein